MSRPMVEVQPIDEVIAELKKNYKRWTENSIESYARRCEEDIAKAIANRQAMADLHAAGVVFQTSKWQSGLDVRIHLGFFSYKSKDNKSLAEQVRRIRLALGCRLENTGKDIADEKKRLVRLQLEPVNFPGIRITFDRKLPKVPVRPVGDKPLPPNAVRQCRMVRRSYMSLECG